MLFEKLVGFDALVGQLPAFFGLAMAHVADHLFELFVGDEVGELHLVVHDRFVDLDRVVLLGAKWKRPADELVEDHAWGLGRGLTERV